MCDFAGYDRPVFFSTTYPRSKRERHCEECGVTIVVGERYARYAGKGDDGMYTSVSCATCDAWADAFVDAQRTYCGESWGWPLGDLWPGIKRFADEHLTAEAMAQAALLAPAKDGGT